MISTRIGRMTPSATCELEGTVSDLRARGIPVIGLNAGEPDFQTPENIRVACNKAIADGKTKYVSLAGIMPLRKAIAEKLKNDNGVEYATDEIIVSTGAKQALFNSIMTVCEPGDEVIIPKPCWVSYVEMVKLADAIPVLVDTNNDDFSLDVSKIKEAVSAKTKAVIINTPNNPTGAVYTEESLRELGELAVKNNFYVITDEVYEKLVYKGKKHVSIAALSSEIKKRVILINGFSKAFAMTGWRIGYAAGPKDIIRGMVSLQGHTTSNSTTFVQWAAVEALTGPQESIEFMRTKFDERREYLYKRLNSMPNIKCADADGAFYLLPDVSGYFGKASEGRKINDSFDFCKYILDEAHVAIVPGAAFESPKTVRIAYSNSLDNIKKGMDQFELALSKLK